MHKLANAVGKTVVFKLEPYCIQARAVYTLGVTFKLINGGLVWQ
jgi:hypothetical protein